MLSARTQEIRAKEGRSPNSHAHLPLVTRVSRSKSFATCQIKSSARYVGYFKCSQISRVVFFFFGGGGGEGLDHRHTSLGYFRHILPVHYNKGLIQVRKRRGLPLSFSPFPSHFTSILSAKDDSARNGKYFIKCKKQTNKQNTTAVTFEAYRSKNPW